MEEVSSSVTVSSSSAPSSFSGKRRRKFRDSKRSSWLHLIRLRLALDLVSEEVSEEFCLKVEAFMISALSLYIFRAVSTGIMGLGFPGKLSPGRTGFGGTWRGSVP